jgi:sec-independent protein translocase protein TatC
MIKVLKLLFWVISAPFRFMAKSIRNVVQGLRYFFADEPDDTPMADSLQVAFEDPGSMLEHVDALRKHILRSIFVLALLSTVAFLFLSDILAWISQPIGGVQELSAVEVTEPIGVAMRLVFLSAFAAALPYITFEFFLFIAPALDRRTRLIGLFSIPLVVVFFFGGMAFAYYLILPTGLPVLINFLDVPSQIRPSSYIRFVTGLMFWFGVVFEFPLLAYVLSAMGFLSPQTLLKNWRIAIVVMSLLAAVITPTIDPINMMLVMVPLVLLYGLSVILSFAAGRRNRHKKEDPTPI